MLLMFDIAMNGILYDVGFIYNFGGLLNILMDKIPSKQKNNPASLCEKEESKTLAEIEELIEAFRFFDS